LVGSAVYCAGGASLLSRLPSRQVMTYSLAAR
jgi:hypothetical protein